jgi:hypothetical protein
MIFQYETTKVGRSFGVGFVWIRRFPNAAEVFYELRSKGFDRVVLLPNIVLGNEQVGGAVEAGRVTDGDDVLPFVLRGEVECEIVEEPREVRVVNLGYLPSLGIVYSTEKALIVGFVRRGRCGRGLIENIFGEYVNVTDVF